MRQLSVTTATHCVVPQGNAANALCSGRRDPARCLVSEYTPQDGMVQDVGVAEECNERFRATMEDTWSIFPSLQVDLSQTNTLAAPEANSKQSRHALSAPQVALPPKHGPCKAVPTESDAARRARLLSSDSLDSSEGTSGPVTPAGSPDLNGDTVRGMTRSGSLENLLNKFPDQLEPSPVPRPQRAQLAAPVERRITCSDLRAQRHLPGGIFFGAVFDGHGGSECSAFLRERMHLNMQREIAFGADPRLPEEDPRRTRSIHDAMLSAYLMTDMHCRKAGITSGSTAVTAVINRDAGGRRWIHVGNVGDSAAIVCRQCPMEGAFSADNRAARAVRLSATHRPCVESERDRVAQAGGFILRQRVVGVLAVTRAMGNHGLKTNAVQHQYREQEEAQCQVQGQGRSGIVARPSCKSLQLESDDRFVVLASDGLTDVMSDQSIVETVCDGVHKMRAASVKRGRPVKHAASTLSKLLVRKAMQSGANDNITAMIIIL